VVPCVPHNGRGLFGFYVQREWGDDERGEELKRNENSRLYHAQMFRSCINSIKENAWVRDYGVDFEKVRKLHLSTFAHSKVKGFMWLSPFQQAPGLEARMPTQHAHCGEVEDIRHMTYDCMVAAYIRDIVFTEWWACTTDSKWVRRSMFESAFFNKNNTTMAVATRTLNDIATFHIWKDRCNVLYGRDITPSVITANNIWVEFTSTIRARLNYIKAKANWWTYRDAV
jgi:hypothetical protein